MQEPRGKRASGVTPIFDDMTDDKDMPSNPIVAGPRRTARAKDYEKKISNLLNSVMKTAAGNPATIADAATIIAHGPAVSAKTGDLADADPRVRRAVDFITSGTENPYLSLALVSIPLVAQLVRNHEMQAPVRVGLKIPFTKRTFKVPFSLKLRNPFLRNMTHEPEDITSLVFKNADVYAAMVKKRIVVAFEGYPMAYEGDETDAYE